MNAFQTRRSTSYPSSEGSTSSPRNEARSDSSADCLTDRAASIDVRVGMIEGQKPQKGPGASSSCLNAPPTGARITLMSTANWFVSFRLAVGIHRCGRRSPAG